MKKKPNAYERFIELSDAEKDAAVAKYDRGVDLRDSRPLSPTQRKLWNKAKRKRGRPRVGEGVEVISLSVEKSLLQKADRIAQSKGISRAALFAQGLQAVLRRAS